MSELKSNFGPLCKEPHLGLATTEEMLIELEARGRTEVVNEVEGLTMEIKCRRLRESLSPEMLSYKTVTSE